MDRFFKIIRIAVSQIDQTWAVPIDAIGAVLGFLVNLYSLSDWFDELVLTANNFDLMWN